MHTFNHRKICFYLHAKFSWLVSTTKFFLTVEFSRSTVLAYTTLIVQCIDLNTYNLSLRDVTTLGSPEIRLLHSPGYELRPRDK